MSYVKNYFHKVPEAKRTAAALAYMASLDAIGGVSPEVAKSIVRELFDQRENLKLIASENFSSLPVQLAAGNLLTDKYSEGSIGHRFYAGCENVDAIEKEATSLVKELFGAEHAYVQPHSGADANLVALWAILVQRVQSKELEKLGQKSIDALSPEEYERIRQLLVNQKMLGMALDAGGHLTHGYRHNVSAKMLRASSYSVDSKTGLLDYAVLQKQVLAEKPLILLAGYSAYPRLIDFAKMREIAKSVGAILLVDMAHFAGLVAGKALRGDFDPIPFAHIVTSTTHKTLRGPRGGLILCQKEFKEVIDKGCPLVLGGPLPHVMAAKALAFREALAPSFRKYAENTISNAQALAAGLMEQGVRVLTNGTDNHLLVFDTKASFDLSGRQAEMLLRKARLTVNRNMIPQDPSGPWYTSGVRLGTPAVTTLGMGPEEMRKIAEWVVRLLQQGKPLIDSAAGKPSLAQAEVPSPLLQEIREEAGSLLKRFPLYPELVF